MKDLLALNAQMTRMWWDAMEVQTATWTTIALRMPHLVNGVGPNGLPTKEQQRMVTEKIVAATQGAHSGAAASMELAQKVMFGKVGATGLASGLLNVAEESTKHAHTKVKANAERLSKARKRK